MDERENLIQQLINIAGSYRHGQIDPFNEAHVNTWLAQFNPGVQLDLLRELVFTLRQTFYSEQKLESEIRDFLNPTEERRNFLTSNTFLDIQQRGSSQHDMLQIASRVLTQAYGVRANINTVSQSNNYTYLDDGIFTGKRVEQDIGDWVENHAPVNATLYIISLYSHAYGEYATENTIRQIVRNSQKNIEVVWRTRLKVEDRLARINVSDVLRPTHSPNEPAVNAYIAQMRYNPRFREPGSRGMNNFFSSEPGRSVVEQEFLKAGVHIRQICPNLNLRQRPLGNSALDTLGFGSMIITYRNCPNNAPLALWVGDPWYPLFPRMTNAESDNRRLLNAFL